MGARRWFARLSWRWKVFVVAALVIVPLVLFGGDEADSGPTPAVATDSATSDVQELLLGENWTGSGEYTLGAAAKAYDPDGDYWTVAARVEAPGVQGLVLFWRADGAEIGFGLICGDSETREFSIWGSAAAVGSPADDRAEDARASAHGRTVPDAVMR